MTEAAREAARRLYKRYNYSNGPFASYELSSLLAETYDYLKIPFKPTQNDIKAYERVLDANGDGKVTLDDFEAKAIEYLCGPGVLGEQTATTNSHQTYDYQVKSSIPQSQGYGGYAYQGQSYQAQQYGQAEQQYSQQQQYEQNQQQYGQAQGQYEQEEERPYSQAVREYLAVVGNVFMTYANPQDYTVTEAEVPSLLSDTYAVLGRQGYYPSEEDTKAWMRLCDVNNDGKVEFQDYQYFVVKSLERSGLNLYE